MLIIVMVTVAVKKGLWSLFWNCQGFYDNIMKRVALINCLVVSESSGDNSANDVQTER